MKYKTNKKLEMVNKSKTWCFEKINKIYKPVARLIKKNFFKQTRNRRNVLNSIKGI